MPKALKNNLDVHFSSKKDDWETPDNFFAGIEKTFGSFILDAAAVAKTSKCPYHFGPDSRLCDDGLSTDWTVFDHYERIGNVWCNPPYAKGITGKWVDKAMQQAFNEGTTTVCLLPARTDTKWFKTCYMYAEKIYFVQGRLKFKGAKHSAPFPSMVVVFSPNSSSELITGLMNTKGEIIG